MPMARTWNGMTIRSKANRAAARALIGMATQVAKDTKIVTHVQYGTLRRSVHVAPVGYMGYSEDETNAVSQDLLAEGMLSGLSEVTPTPLGPAVEVGSWLRYACAEWIGRGHPGVTEGLEAARPGLGRYMVQAFREEGL